ncbi:MAG TPA: hypothetical protein PL110_12355 [Candidatus Eremiobacteraeota bacterium]|nr:MAG: Sugar-binding cellulase-like protein [bacterium ADurb.Bin363]HPZ08902.1 hypothetical protein [Candidatus Eremiobacteraeota bacterium]
MSFKKSGVNLSWEKDKKYMHYGYSIGMSVLNKSYHTGFSNPHSNNILAKAFKKLSEKGIKTIRVFLFCDLRAGIHFNEKGYPYFDEKVYADSFILMNTARTYKLELIPVLLDFYVANRWLLNYFDPFDHPEILTNDRIRYKLQELFGEYIKYYSETFGGVIQAWDLFNEPEWARAISLKTIIPENDPRAIYIKEMYEIARKNSQGIPVTVGWNKKENAIKFKDFSDIIQAHCYKEKFSIFLDYLLENSKGKKILAGEVGARNSNHMEELMKIAKEKDVAILFWDTHNSNFASYICDYDKFKHYSLNISGRASMETVPG